MTAVVQLKIGYNEKKIQWWFFRCECQPCQTECQSNTRKVINALGAGTPGSCCQQFEENVFILLSFVKKTTTIESIIKCVSIESTSYPTQSCGELDGELRLVKENWYTNECTICSCHTNGDVTCEEVTCDLHTCDLYARNRLLPILVQSTLQIRDHYIFIFCQNVS